MIWHGAGEREEDNGGVNGKMLPRVWLTSKRLSTILSSPSPTP
jgi:hypothetical protein